MSLGKLRKWGKGFAKDLKGPSSSDPSSPTSPSYDTPPTPSAFDDDLRALDDDLALRRRGFERLLIVSSAYSKQFFKRKDFDDPSSPGKGKKMHPGEALGGHLARFGEALAEREDTPFARGLQSLGRARMELVGMGRELGRSWEEGWQVALERGLVLVKDVQGMRKGLDKKKQAYEASVARMQKAKNDRNAEVMEEDVARTLAAYESTLQDVQARVLEIEEFESSLLAQTVQLVEDELEYANAYREILMGVKEELGGDGGSYEPKRRSARPPPFPRRPSARSLHSSHSLHSIHSLAPSLSSSDLPPSPRSRPGLHLRTQSHLLRRENSGLSRGQSSPLGRRRAGTGGSAGWSEIAGGGELNGLNGSEGEDDESLVSGRQRSDSRARWPGDDSDSDPSTPSHSLPYSQSYSQAQPGQPPKLPSRHPSLGKLSIPPALPPRTPPRGTPLTPIGAQAQVQGRGSKLQDGFSWQSEEEHSDLPAQHSDSEGELDGEGSDADPVGGGWGGRTPAQERPDPVSATLGRAPAPAVPPRRAGSLRSPPPTPPRRNGSYLGGAGGGAKVESAKSPFDTTDESDA